MECYYKYSKPRSHSQRMHADETRKHKHQRCSASFTRIAIRGVILCLVAFQIVLKGKTQYEIRQLQTERVEQQQQPLSYPIIDVMAVGSQIRPEYLDAGHRTYGSHPAVRHFFRIDERDDTDQDCASNLSREQVDHVLNFCGNKRNFKKYPLMQLWRKLYMPKKFLDMKPNPPGWICAQTRPIDGLLKVLKHYTKNSTQIPDYLLVGDDDTYYNMKVMLPTLTQLYPPSQPTVAAACLVERRTLTFPYGGWGTIFTKKALQNFMKPLQCDGDPLNNEKDLFVKMACEQLNRNEIGERDRFQPGMSVVDLMHAYSTANSFLNIDTSWKGTPGFCMHSDIALTYFINVYHIPMNPETDSFFTNTTRREKVTNQLVRGLTLYSDINDDVRRNNEKNSESPLSPTNATPNSMVTTDDGKLPTVGKTKDNCSNGLDSDKCTLESTICHYMTPADMERLHAEN